MAMRCFPLGTSQTRGLPPISVDTLAAASSLVIIRSSSSSSSRRKKSMKPKPSTAFKYILQIPMALGVIPTHDTSARCHLSFSTRA